MGITNDLYRAARASATARAAARGPKALAKREVRRRIYRVQGQATRRILRRLGL